METEDEARQALGELATLFIRIGRALAQQGLGFFDTLYEALALAVGGEQTVDALLCAMQAHHIPVAPGITDESFDSCIHCKADVVNAEEHGNCCPVITDVWPITWMDVVGELTCSSCPEVFEFGDFYVSLPEVRCLPCAFKGDAA